ncbi:MAG: cytochrome c biogenesis protein CcdA [Rhodospirillales bacterium]|nr:cytochrome c biogenesis protein CcdA [Rhodospirillales bacterium]MCW8863118.1 cytochrome c biogenesis protein CcdA [Rhodospirillales bacterium]MCW8951211.1 cytochrome c biogenesis protein CcdA [Rhodospirillales bacterium]MCW8971523.1 cytochrome c biogenesis protein CcdA [Rhodospirillales bacterium]MCW9001733.1 cytochrome c biogenesis protein CcdA [Rhodospirillales bacterium]
MDGMEVTYAGALLAGLLSFVSPCVLPLVPAYLCFLGGASLDQLTTEKGVDRAVSRRVFVSAVAFVLGFGTVFVILGATATVLSRFIAENLDVLGKIAGVVIVVFGLHYMGLFRIGFLNFEKRFHVEDKPSGLVGAYFLGLAFAFGWTPCVGPVLATILMVAAAGDSVTYGISLLSVYAAGIGVPFLIAALAVRPFMAFMARFRKHMRKVEISIGSLLVLTGVLIFSGSLAEVGQWLLETFPVLGRVG